MEKEKNTKEEYFKYTEKLLGAAFERASKGISMDEKSNEIDIKTNIIWNFMQSRRIKRRNYMTDKEKEQLKQQFTQYVKRQYKKRIPILFYLFDLPMKTGLKQETDLGEEIMIRNLESISRNIEKVYPYGVKFLILCDGDIFSISKVTSHNKIQEYINNIKKIIQKFNIKNVQISDWHTYIFKDNTIMERSFALFKKKYSYKNFISNEIEIKTRKRCKELAKKNYTNELESELLYARAFFEKNKKIYFEKNKNFGFKLTKGGFKRSEPSLAIYPADPNIETSVSRGKTNLIKKESGIIIPILKTQNGLHR